MHFKDFHGYELKIYFRKSTNEFNYEANIFFKNLSADVKAKELNDLCEEFGNILSCQIKNDDKGNSLGYAYVQYETPEEANAAIEKLNGQEKWGKPLEVQKFVSQRNRKVEKKNVYIKQFPNDWTQEKIEKFLEEKFLPIGEIESQGVYEKEINNEKKFFAFIAYKDK